MSITVPTAAAEGLRLTVTPFRPDADFGGGAKDSGGRVTDALLRPESEYGRRIRGW